MMEAIEFMTLPFLTCLLLVGINVYFGIHVIKREIIFIDIALAQMAAFGGAVAVVLHHAPDTGHGHSHEGEGALAYGLSIVCVVLASGLFTLLKDNRLRIPLEALIGVTYAAAATGAVILLDTMAGSDVHLQEMLAGSILWVTGGDVLHLLGIFVLIGGIHFVYREKFIGVTHAYESAGVQQVNKLWDFIFYATFGISVVHSVSVGGILTVFAFLIIPASISLLFAQSWAARILIGWGIGSIVSVSGLYLSWSLDVPSGPTVILCLGVFLFFVLLLKMAFRWMKHASHA